MKVRCKKSVYGGRTDNGWSSEVSDRQFFTAGKVYEANREDDILYAECDDEGDTHDIMITNSPDDEFYEFFEFVEDEQDVVEAYDRAMRIV